jgi:hypothetical protein
MEIIVTSYKYCRKSPCEAEVASLRICFELLAASTDFACLSLETLFVYTYIFVVCNGLRYRGGAAVHGA